MPQEGTSAQGVGEIADANCAEATAPDAVELDRGVGLLHDAGACCDVEAAGDLLLAASIATLAIEKTSLPKGALIVARTVGPSADSELTVRDLIQNLNTNQMIRVNTVGFHRRPEGVDPILSEIAQDNNGTYYFSRSYKDGKPPQ